MISISWAVIQISICWNRSFKVSLYSRRNGGVAESSVSMRKNRVSDLMIIEKFQVALRDQEHLPSQPTNDAIRREEIIALHAILIAGEANSDHCCPHRLNGHCQISHDRALVTEVRTRYNTRMITVTFDEMQRDLAAYLRRVEAGESLILVRDEIPVAEIKPIARPSTERRPFGLCAGEFTVPDDFDDPLPEEVLRLFEGK
jgi:antitoxin (DNA-binding transcriptional repressor) of toxin-antitoxin stability system